MAIADVDEHQRPEIANPMDPAEQHDVLADVGGARAAAGMRARKCSERLVHALLQFLTVHYGLRRDLRVQLRLDRHRRPVARDR